MPLPVCWHVIMFLLPVGQDAPTCVLTCDNVSVTSRARRPYLCVCLLLRFGRKVYALKALFTLLRLSCQILRFWAAVSDFGLTTIDLCDKSYRLSTKTATEWCTWKTRFGWLPVMQDPINIKLTRTFARTWIFSLATTFSDCTSSEFWTMSSKRNRERGSCDDETGVWKKKSFLVRVFYGLPVAPIFEIRAEVRTVPRVKLIFQITVAGETCTHTHTHTEGCQVQPFAYATVYTALCSRQKGYGH